MTVIKNKQRVDAQAKQRAKVFLLADSGELGPAKTDVVKIIPIEDMAVWRNLEKFKAIRKFCSQNRFGILITDAGIPLKQL